MLNNNIKSIIEKLHTRFPRLTVHENEPMAPHCSFRAGGPVGAFAAPDSIGDFTSVLSLLYDCNDFRARGVTPFVLGNGTNVVFPDEGCPSVFVLSTENLQNIELLPDGVIRAEAGVSLARLASFALEHSLAGLEFASGIPGTVGGGAVMNAGAYGGELKDVIHRVTYFSLGKISNAAALTPTVDRSPRDSGSSPDCHSISPDRSAPLQDESEKDGVEPCNESLCTIPGAACGFGYRTSVFQQDSSQIVLSADFALTPGDSAEISGKMRELNARRREKQPLDLPSAGSAFRRPAGYFAAALIEECGLKGTRVGGAQVSEKHAGFIVNAGFAANTGSGSATARDLRELICLVRETILREKGIALVPEVILLSPEGVPYSPDCPAVDSCGVTAGSDGSDVPDGPKCKEA